MTSCILINRQEQGNFAFSQEFRDYARQNCKEFRADVSRNLRVDNSIEQRSAPALIALVQQFGLEASASSVTTFRIIKVPSFAKPYIRIRAANGQEWLQFNMERYWEDLVATTLTPPEIVAAMSAFVSASRSVMTQERS